MPSAFCVPPQQSFISHSQSHPFQSNFRLPLNSSSFRHSKHSRPFQRKNTVTRASVSTGEHDSDQPFNSAPTSTSINSTSTSGSKSRKPLSSAAPSSESKSKSNSNSNSSSRVPNALINETSRYLVESAFDKVQWYPWGSEAFKLAHDTQRPILLSTGFLSCHICDVMDRHYREPALADLLNRKFVCIKVDREERPDVDSVYNAFVQAVTGRSGWPITCFLTPRLIPFVGTTYLPPDRLADAVRSIADRWENSSHLVERDGLKVLNALRNLFGENSQSDPSEKLSPDVLRRAFHAADSCFDVENGGFGSVPKFPRPAVFEFLLAMHVSAPIDDRVKTESLDMVLDSLREMAAGGIHDHIGGGFFRYALDAAWHVPHFEKLLSDQAQLASSYLNAYLITRDDFYKRIACETLDFVIAEMTDDDTGFFYSAIHADSPSQYAVTAISADGDSGQQQQEQIEMEGAYYTFSSFELKLILGEPASTIFHERFGVEPLGNVCNEPTARAEYGGLEGLNVLRISATFEEIASEVRLPVEKVERILDESIERVRHQRSRRPRPRMDDLAITCWNSLAISAFARAGAALHRPDYLDVALRTADTIMTKMVTRERTDDDCVYLARGYRDGIRGKVEAFGEDYSDAIQAFLDCYEVTGDAKYLLFARRLQNTFDADFWWEDGGYTNCKRDEPDILIRRKEDYDGAEPSSSSVGALNLVRLASLLGDSTLWQRARKIARSYSKVLNASPLAMPVLLVAVQALMTGESKKVVVVGNNEDAEKMLDQFWARGLQRSVALLRVTGAERTSGETSQGGGSGIEGEGGIRNDEQGAYLECLKRYLRNGAQRELWTWSGDVSAFVCDGETCLEPTKNVGKFSEELEYLLESTQQLRSVDGI